MHRRKLDVLQQAKRDYLTHIHKLSQLNNQTTKSITRQQSKIDNLLRNSHNIHNKALQYEFRRRKQVQLTTTRSQQLSNAQSVVKNEIVRQLLTIPRKHIPNLRVIEAENNQMVHKILSAKSTFNFKQCGSIGTNIHSRTSSNGNSKINTTLFQIDYSRLYQQCLGRTQHKKLQLLHPIKKSSVRIMLYFLDVAGIKNIVRDLETMLIVVYAGDNDRVKRSKVFTLGMLLTAEVGLGLTQKYVGRRGVLSFCQLVGDKELVRFKVFLEGLDDDSCENRSAVIKDCKNRQIGLVSFTLQKRKKRFEMKEDDDQDKLCDNKAQKQNIE